MNQVETDVGPVKVFTPEETAELFVPLRDRIFDMAHSPYWKECPLFRDESWVRVIIRGAVAHSDRSAPPREPYTTLEEWVFGDRRDELQPLFDLLIEDGVFDVVHMSPFGDMETVGRFGSTALEKAAAVTTRPTGPAVRSRRDSGTIWSLPERLLFDRTGRWGMYGSEEMFGLLGGEPAFMERYIERCGGMEFIRMKADKYWQSVIDENDVEADLVPHYYELAGWDNPPRRRDG